MMIGFDNTITIYNRRLDKESKYDRWLKTVISGVSWSGCQRVTASDGLTSNDGYSVRIPKGSMPEGFVKSDEFNTLPDPTGYWTAQNGDVVLLGEGPDVEGGIKEVTRKYSDCFTVTATHTDNLLRPLSHLRLEGC